MPVLLCWRQGQCRQYGWYDLTPFGTLNGCGLQCYVLIEDIPLPPFLLSLTVAFVGILASEWPEIVLNTSYPA